MGDREFEAWKSLPEGGGYKVSGWWSSVGEHALDRKFTRLADLYMAAKPARRKAIRRAFDWAANEGALMYGAWMYIKRIGLLIRSPADVEWLRRGLVVAAIEGGRGDYRETIFAMVVLRYAAERAGIDTRPYFDKAIALADASAVEFFENARDHRHSDVVFTVNQCGPPDWPAEVKKKTR